jgi:hypothetical protein
MGAMLVGTGQLDAGIVRSVLQTFTGVVLDSGAAIALIVRFVAIGIKSVGFLARKIAESQKSIHNIDSSISITDTGVGARGEPTGTPRALPLGFVVLAFQAGSWTLILHREISSSLGRSGRGTGVDYGEGEFSPGWPRDHGARLVALSSLALSISVPLQGVPASHRTGFKTASKMRLF